EPMVIALPASHPLAQRITLPLAALADAPFILFPRLVGLSLSDDVVLPCRKAGFELTVAQEAPQISSVVTLVAADLGV
ncbi:LysR substrate-binding domain-containing protein, partial [Rhizobium leguminosarum]|uniref:LysR substrate-binding domain-containing protein n=1 Tax=Rhizobium leguminosarum TaxID=384 RepID=UPI003F983399